jgi:N-carbamoylputrescine amidase
MSFRLATCEFPDEAASAEAMWRCLERTLTQRPVDLLVLPELAGVDSFWGSSLFDAGIWHEAVGIHAKIAEKLEPLRAKRIVGTRALEQAGQRWNQAFLWTPEDGLTGGRCKAWLPQEEGGWEATWFDSGQKDISTMRSGELCFATLVCTEIMVSSAARSLGQAGVQVIAAPRATSGHSRWEVATRMAAIAAGAFVVTANRRGHEFAGGSWIVTPDGEVLARTSDGDPIICLDVELAAANAAKCTYPRNVKD